MSLGLSNNGYRSNIVHTPAVVRSATVDDLSEIVAIHEKAFSTFFLTRLGPGFLRKYYRLVLTYNTGIILVSEKQDTVKGFVCGFVNPEEFYRLMWSGKMTFTLPVLSALLRQPSLIRKVVSSIQRIQTPLSDWPAGTCELSSIAVEPEASGNGLGNALIRAFLACARSMDAHCVYLTTDADGNDAANDFYRAVGFQHTRRFLQREARWMNEYVINDLGEGESCTTRVSSERIEVE